MSDDELDQVAGGSRYETALDAQFLRALNGSCRAYTAGQVLGGEHNAEIAAAWKSVGIIAFLDSGGYEEHPTEPCYNVVDGNRNFYAIMPDPAKGEVGLRTVSRAEAMQYAVNYVKSH